MVFKWSAILFLTIQNPDRIIFFTTSLNLFIFKKEHNCPFTNKIVLTSPNHLKPDKLSGFQKVKTRLLPEQDGGPFKNRTGS
jgi:hypothetical protein